MDTDTAEKIGNYILNNATGTLDGKAELKKDDTQVKITLDNSSLIKTGSNTIEITDKVKDAYGNKVDKDTRISFNAEKDEEKPEVVSVEAIDSETIRVRFNEDVKYRHATNKSNYELRDSNGIRIDETDIDKIEAANGLTDDDTDVYDIKMKTDKKLTGDKYTLKIKNIADTSDNVMDDCETKFNGEDDEAPTVKGISRTEKKVFVRFSEKMDRASLRKTENYRFIDEDNKVKELPSKATITVASDDKTVTIEFSDAYEKANKIKGFIVKSDVKDVAGNKMEADYRVDQDKDGNFDKLDNISVKENSMKVSRNGDDVEVELVFDAAVDTVDKDKITFEGKKANSVRINGDKVTFKFNDGEEADAVKKAGTGLKAGIQEGSVKGKAGETIAAKDVPVYDNLIAPELNPDEKDGYVGNTDKDKADSWKVAVKEDKATITISFDTQIADLGKAYADDFKFMADNTGNELDLDDEIAPAVNGNTITYTFKDINELKGVKTITIKADKDNVDVRTKKDLANNDQKYKPTNDDINGWKLKVGTAIDDALKAKEEVAKAKDAFDKEVAKYVEGSYTADSWKTFKAVVDAETAKVKAKDATKDTVNASTQAVKDAADKLVTVAAQELAEAKEGLTKAIAEANTAKAAVTESTDGSDVEKTEKWATKDQITTFSDAIKVATTAFNKADATVESLTDAKTTLTEATTAFNKLVQNGTK